MEHKVMWLSSGVSSAVALMLEKENIDTVIYIDIEDQHKDSIRFNNDVSNYTGKKIETIKSEYNNVEQVCRRFKYVNGPAGARCTLQLKRNVRKTWENDNSGSLRYYWGFDCDEKKRAQRIVESMPQFEHSFPLINRNIKKEDAHAILLRSGIKRPIMYDMGYGNNNCIGCVKGGKGYWNKIRVDFPAVFRSRAVMERDINRSCIKGCFLDVLDPSEGRDDEPISQECGIYCHLNRA